MLTLHPGTLVSSNNITVVTLAEALPQAQSNDMVLGELQTLDSYTLQKLSGFRAKQQQVGLRATGCMQLACASTSNALLGCISEQEGASDFERHLQTLHPHGSK